MDLYSYLLHLVLLCSSLSVIILIYKRKCNGVKLPPGRKGWPILGETWEFAMASRRGNPEKFIMDRMMKYSSEVFQTSLRGEKLAVFCGASGNKFLFSNENKYVTSWWPDSIRKIITFTDEVNKSSTSLRRFLLEFVKPEALQHYIPIMDSMAKEHLETEWLPYKEVKVYPLVKKYTLAQGCRLFMRIKDPKDVTKLAEPFTLIRTGLMSAPVNLRGTAFNRAIQGGKAIRAELLAIIAKRKLELSSENNEIVAPDMLSRMLLQSDENGEVMNETVIASKIIGLLIASYATTSTSLTFVLNYLAEYPDVYAKVLKEQMEIARSKGEEESLNWDDIKKMKYSWCVACEAMRLSPPSQGTFREVITDFTYAGFTIPKGWKAYWTVHSTHKDPEYFPDPEKFDPSRFEGHGPAPYTFVPFGGGPRVCPGKDYARLQILIFMHNVVTKFKLEKVIPDEKITYNPGPIPVNGLPIRLETHIK